MPCNVNTALDVSMPTRLYWVMDGSGPGCSQPQFWHAMPWGRPPQHFLHVGDENRSKRCVPRTPSLSGPQEPMPNHEQIDQPAAHPEPLRVLRQPAVAHL